MNRKLWWAVIAIFADSRGRWFTLGVATSLLVNRLLDWIGM